MAKIMLSFIVTSLYATALTLMECLVCQLGLYSVVKGY